MEFIKDANLLKFRTYQQYLRAMITPTLEKYFDSDIFIAKMFEAGVGRATKAMTSEEFKKRRAVAHDTVYCAVNTRLLASKDIELVDDYFLKALAERERANRIGILSTIIFLRDFTKAGYEVSGYIDFGYSIRQTRGADVRDWAAIFRGRKRLRPTPNDLAYFNWHSNVCSCKSNENYEVVNDPIRGLVFVSELNRKIICPNPKEMLSRTDPSITRTEVPSTKYHQVVLYDHLQ